jgi:hypothetical protein
MFEKVMISCQDSCLFFQVSGHAHDGNLARVKILMRPFLLSSSRCDFFYLLRIFPTCTFLFAIFSFCAHNFIDFKLKRKAHHMLRLSFPT